MRRVGQERQPSFSSENPKSIKKIAVRYVFMAEELLRGPERDADAIERADQPAPQGRLGLPSARDRGNERAEFA